jgi:hypothetical protein
MRHATPTTNDDHDWARHVASPSTSQSARPDPVKAPVALTYELLDAHTDTIDLAAKLPTDPL